MITNNGFFKKGKMSFVILMGVVLLVGSSVGSTVAWLITKTEPVVNTFTYGDIDITLDEDPTDDDDDNPNTNTYQMVPGNIISKNPTVTVKADSEDAWLFVKLEKSMDPKFDDFMEYTVADGWTALEGVDGVYYREVTKTDVDTEYYVLKGNEQYPEGIVTVKESVTKEMLNALTAYPTLTITAYAVQRDAGLDAIDTAGEAWTLIQ